jgi:hypothetical protein
MTAQERVAPIDSAQVAEQAMREAAEQGKQLRASREG